MPRYFIEVSYKGTRYSGFQIQKNAVTIQSEVEKALKIYFRQSFSLTGSSRTDAGVHALQNYFHFDVEQPLGKNFSNQSGAFKMPEVMAGKAFTSPEGNLEEVYNLNAILPKDIVIKRIFPVADKAHCRFDALSREYKYFIYRNKDPFLQDKAFYFPYNVEMDQLNAAAQVLLEHKDFTSFSKRNTQVNNFNCDITKSGWMVENDTLIFTVKANRFLRGMVKGLVGTMLKVGTRKISLNQFNDIINNRDCSKADFSVPSHALFLIKVSFDSF
jgi:tRNA pseudouridine38-40 synthase